MAPAIDAGEWIASDWPVCRLADTANPHHMGAALTYARRYALLTLVGIAGEDDLDAPDLNGRPESGTTGGGPSSEGPSPDKYPMRRANDRESGRITLGPRASAAMRDELVTEVAKLGSLREAVRWARTAIAAKNTLTGSYSRLVELAFELPKHPRPQQP